MRCKERLEGYFRDNGVPYQIQHHPIAYTAQGTAEAERLPGELLAKVVMVKADGGLAMLVTTAPAHIDLTKAARAMGVEEARLAAEDEFAATFPDCEVGAMPPFGNLYGVMTYVDRALADDETIYFPAGTHTDTMSVHYADFERLAKPVVTDIA